MPKNHPKYTAAGSEASREPVVGELTQFERFIAKLREHDCKVTVTGNTAKSTCPGHQDQNESLSISETNTGVVLLKCFGGCSNDKLLAPLGLSFKDLFPEDERTGRAKGCSLTEYANAKVLPIDFLTGLGLKDGVNFGIRSISIPYKDVEGNTVAVRFRMALGKGKGKDARFLWEKNAKLCCYGLDRLDSEANWVLVVEGESDAQTAWLYDINALGVPGAANFKPKRDDPHLARFEKIYVIMEPDAGGEGFVRSLAKSQHASKIWVIDPHPYKDVNEAHVTDPEGYAAWFDRAKGAARPLSAILEDLSETLGSTDMAKESDSREGDGEKPVGRVTQKIREAMEFLNERHFIAPIGSKVVIGMKVVDPINGSWDYTFLSSAAFKLLYENRRIYINNEKIQSIAEIWLQHPGRRQYAGVTFLPGKDAGEYFNLFSGFQVEPGDFDTSLYWQHVREVICAGDVAVYSYLRKWMAHAIQKPSELPEVAVVVRGSQGCGKGLFVLPFGKLFGNHFSHLLQMNQVSGRFNGHLKNAILIYANEAALGGDKNGEGTLKGLITDPIVPVEGKFQDIINVPNFHRLIVSSNEDWVVPRGLDDRRYLVLEASEDMVGDRGYFGALALFLEGDGLRGLMRDLLAEDLTGFEPRDLPASQKGFDLKLRSASGVAQWLFEKLQSGVSVAEDVRLECTEWFKNPPKRAVHDDYVEYVKRHGLGRPETSPNFGKMLKDCLPRIEIGDKKLTVNVYDSSMKNIGKQKVWCYQLPDLAACRRAFERRVKEGAWIWGSNQ